jgi:hypothetical protein
VQWVGTTQHAQLSTAVNYTPLGAGLDMLQSTAGETARVASCSSRAEQGGMMRVRASRTTRGTVRLWPRALLREAPEIFEIPHWPLGWLLLARERRDVRAPMDGLVHRVPALAEGDLIAARQPLMRILPADAEIEFEARLSSRSVRWIVEGQWIALRLAPSTRESPVNVEGEVTWVGREAVNDAHAGPIFPVRIRIASQSLADRHLAFALAARAEKRITADIQLGAQSVIDLVTYGLLYKPMNGMTATVE